MRIIIYYNYMIIMLPLFTSGADDILKKNPPKKLVGAVSYEPLVLSQSNLMWWLSEYF